MAFKTGFNDSSKTDVKRLIKSLSDCLDMNGVPGTIRILERKDMDMMKYAVDKQRIMLALQKKICEAFKMDNIDDLFGTTRGYPRKYAFAAWSHICYKTCNYSLGDIMEFSNKIKSIISKSVKFYSSLDDSSKLKREVKAKAEPIRNEFKRN